MVIITSELAGQIYEDACNKYPYECCGILLGEWDRECRIVKRVFRVNNAAEEKAQRSHFVIQAEAFLYAEYLAAKENYEIVGFYHSHVDCDAIASEEDSNFAIPEISYLIVSVKAGQVKNMFSYQKMCLNETESFVKENIVIGKQGEYRWE
jgi:proteasome lid subunit RPN8/RPN11